MANVSFGVNIIPKSNTNVTIGNSDHPWTIVSPNMTGTPTAPTAEEGTDTTQVATTAFVNNAVSDKQDAPSSGAAAGKVLGLTEVDNELVPTWVNQSSGTVTDVQVNGTSVVNNGVANVPLADDTHIGAVKINSTYGFGTTPEGYLRVNGASTPQVKGGSEYYRPIIPANQHLSTFYGLATAAGDSTQSASSNPVGTYTADAKTAIKSMLGVSEPTSIIDDTAGSGDTNKVWSADKAKSEVSVLQVSKAPIIIDTTEGAVASFPDGADNLSLTRCIVNIDSVQNLNGYDYPWAAGCGKNIFNSEGTKIDNQYIANDGQYVSSNTACIYTDFIPVQSSTQYSAYGKTTIAAYIRVAEYSSDGTFITRSVSASSYSPKVTFTTTATTAFLRISPDTYISPDKLQVELGAGPATTSDYTFSPYSNVCPITGWTGCNVSHSGADTSNPTVHSISWQTEAGTVYGGTLNVLTGLLTVTHSQIASYNGETLPSEWISDRDAYASGTVPTTGAQVVYELSEAQTYQLTPVEMKTLLGENNIWADTGDTEVTYMADTKLFCQKNDKVDDVRVNGISVVSDGVANVQLTSIIDDTAGSGDTSEVWSADRVSKIIGASEYDVTHAYTVYDYCIHNNTLYKCIAENLTAEAWNSNHWTAVSVSEELNNIVNWKIVSNYNDFKPTGTKTRRIYGQSTGGNALNVPVTGDNITYRAEAEGTTSYFTQRLWIEYATTVANRGRMFIRQCLGGVFNSWKEIGTVTDVQVNGTSVVSNGVANVPIAGDSLGVVKIEGGYGIAKNSSGRLYISGASDSVIKTGEDSFSSIVPSRQEKAVFYGLAKVAGADMKNVTGETIGVYPEAQKLAIEEMLATPSSDDTVYLYPQDFTSPTTASSNASTVINTAITSASTASKHYVVLPAGEYWLTGTIYLKSNVILKGNGMDSTILKIATGSDIDAVRVSEPTNNSGLMDLTIDGNRIDNYSTFSSGHHGNAINVWLHYGRIERVRTNWVYKHSLLLNYDTGSSDDGLNFESAHQNDMGNLNKVLWCDFRDSLLQSVMWGWRTRDSWMCYTNIGSHASNLYLEGGTSRFIGNHFDGDGDNGAGPEYNVYCGDGCNAMVFDGNIFENTQKENIYFRKPSYSNQSRSITIINNIIRTCSKSTNNTYANIFISGYDANAKAEQIIIGNNQILNPDTNGNHGYAGIHLDFCNDVKIIGNTYFNVGANNVVVEDTCSNIVNDKNFALIDDFAGSGDTDRAWSANKITTELNLKAPKANPTFTGSINLGRKSGTTVGTNSVATGNDVIASGYYSYAEGSETTASNYTSHAEGDSALASGDTSHAEGYRTTASGMFAHAEGCMTESTGYGSHAEGESSGAYAGAAHAEGLGTKNYYIGAHTGGKYNAPMISEWEAPSEIDIYIEPDTKYAVGDYVLHEGAVYQCTTANSSSTFDASEWSLQQYGAEGILEIIGNGASHHTPSNARLLKDNGDEYLKGTLYVNCNSDSSGGTAVLGVDSKTITATTYANLQSSLASEVDGMAQGETKLIRIITGSGTYEPFITSNIQVGYLTCTYVSGTRKDLTVTFTNPFGDSVCIGRYNGTWNSQRVSSGWATNFSSATTLSAFLEKVDTLCDLANKEGIVPIGYLLQTAAVSIGLPSGGWYAYAFTHAGNTRRTCFFRAIQLYDRMCYIHKVDTWETAISSCKDTSIGAISGATRYEFITNLVAQLRTTYDFSSSMVQGQTITGKVDWTSTTNYSICVTKLSSASVLVVLNGAVEVVRFYFAVSDGTINQIVSFPFKGLYNVSLNGTAPNDMVAGEFILYNGTIYKTKTAVTAGTTLSTSTHLSSVNHGALNDLKFSINKPVESWTGTIDLNDKRTPGLFYSNNATVSNMPDVGSTSKYFFVLNIGVSESIVYQYVLRLDATCYSRVYANSAWTAWKSFTNDKNIAICASGSTAPFAISKGQYVMWSGTLYTAKSAIASGATLSTSNLQAVGSGGGLNALNSSINEIHYYNGSNAFASVSAFETKMTELFAAMDDREKTQTVFNFTATEGVFKNGYYYFAHLMKTSGEYGTIVAYGVGARDTIVVSKTTGGYTYSNITEEINAVTITNFNTFLPYSASPQIRMRIGFVTADGATNAPFTGDNTTFRVAVFGHSTYCTQIAVSEYSTDQRNEGRIFVRNYINSTWRSWREISGQKYGWVPTNTDLDDVIQPGVYGLSATSTYTNSPTSGIGGIMEVFGPSVTGSYFIQRVQNSSKIYTRYRANSSGTAWMPWAIYSPNREYQIAKSSSQSYTVSNNSRIRIDTFGGANGLIGSINVSVNSSGGVNYYKTGATDLTITTGTRTLTIANGNTSAACVIFTTEYYGAITVNS